MENLPYKKKQYRFPSLKGKKITRSKSVENLFRLEMLSGSLNYMFPVKTKVNFFADNFSGDTPSEVVRLGGRLQRDGDGAAGSLAGGPVQLLLAPFLAQDGAAVGRSADIAHRLHTLEELHTPRH